MITTVINTDLDVDEDGSIKRKLKSGKWKTIKNNVNHNKGYNVIRIENSVFINSTPKQYNRVILYCEDGIVKKIPTNG